MQDIYQQAVADWIRLLSEQLNETIEKIASAPPPPASNDALMSAPMPPAASADTPAPALTPAPAAAPTETHVHVTTVGSEQAQVPSVDALAPGSSAAEAINLELTTASVRLVTFLP